MRVKSYSFTTINVYWSQDNIGTAASFTILLKDELGTILQKGIKVTSYGGMYRFDNLQNGTKYNVEIFGSNHAGNGSTSRAPIMIPRLGEFLLLETFFW